MSSDLEAHTHVLQLENLNSNCMAARRSPCRALQQEVLPQGLLPQHSTAATLHQHSSYFASELNTHADNSSTHQDVKSHLKAYQTLHWEAVQDDTKFKCLRNL